MTTIRINLLPHREERRAQQQRTLVTLIIAAALAGVAVVVIGHVTIASMTSRQNQRNEFLKQQIAKLDKRIQEISKLKQETNALLDRKKVVETLQANRTETVHLFDQLARRLPDGMYLRSVKQTGNKLTLTGYAQSSARVSELMRNIRASQWLAKPQLIEVTAVRKNKQRINEFKLDVQQVVPSLQSPASGSAMQHKAGSR